MKAVVEKKAEGRTRIGSLLIYRSCDKIYKDVLRKEETEGKFSLNGTDGDAERTELVGKITNLIARDSAIERISREVEILSIIYSFTGKKKGSPRIVLKQV